MTTNSCVIKTNVSKYVKFNGTNYMDIYKLWPNGDVIFSDGERMPLQKWACELGGYSPFEDGPEYIILYYFSGLDTVRSECVYRNDILIVEPISSHPLKCTEEEFKRNWVCLDTL